MKSKELTKNFSCLKHKHKLLYYHSSNIFLFFNVCMVYIGNTHTDIFTLNTFIFFGCESHLLHNILKDNP